MLVCPQSVLKSDITVIVARSGAFGWHNIFLWKLLQSDVFLLLYQRIIKGPWSPKLTYTFYPFSWKCRILW